MRDPLVTPAVGDVIEGRLGGCVYRWTVGGVTEHEVSARLVVTYPSGDTGEDEACTVPPERWHDWSGYRDVRAVTPPRDPLVDPEPGDVVRATDIAMGDPRVIVVLDVDDGLVLFSWSDLTDLCCGTREESMEAWRDWSAWTDVAVLS